MIPALTAEGVVVCSIDGKELHPDWRSLEDALEGYGTRIRITCGDHDVWVEFRGPLMAARTKPELASVGSKACLQCGLPLEAKRQHMAKVHTGCVLAFRKAKRQAALPPKLRGRRQGENLKRKPSALARMLKEQTMAGSRRSAKAAHEAVMTRPAPIPQSFVRTGGDRRGWAEPSDRRRHE